jgi:hypothetical protein
MIFSPIALCPKKTSQFSPFFGNSFAEFEPRFFDYALFAPQSGCQTCRADARLVVVETSVSPNAGPEAGAPKKKRGRIFFQPRS